MSKTTKEMVYFQQRAKKNCIPPYALMMLWVNIKRVMGRGKIETKIAPEVILDGSNPVKTSSSRSFENHYNRSFRMKLFKLRWVILMLSLYIVLGLVIGLIVEGWRFLNALNFTVVTLTTVGYGDNAPKTQLGRLLTTIFIIYGAILITWLVGYVTRSVSSTMSNSRTQFTQTLSNMDEKKRHGKIHSLLYDDKYKLLRSIAVAFLIVVGGVIFLIIVEDLCFIDSLYFCVVTLSTVGYGDLNPQLTSDLTQVFLIFYVLFGTISVANVLGASIESVLEAEQEKMRNDILKQAMTLQDLQEADEDNSGTLDEPEFIIFKLRQMGLIQISDIKSIQEQFRILDSDHSGQITFEEALAA